MSLRPLILATAAALCAPLPGQALRLELPANALQQRDELRALDSHRLPLSGWQDGGMETVTIEGEVAQRVWRIPASGLTTLQLIAPLRDQIEQAGYDIVFECRDRACGGFDFRYAIDVAPEPDMHVDLGAFRFLAARKPGSEDAAFSVLVSRSGNTGFVQVTEVRPATAKAAETAETEAAPSGQVVDDSPVNGASASPRSGAAGDFGRHLEDDGAVVLDGLSFATGSAQLGAGDNPSLAALADYLAANPSRRVALVGHTDVEGSLAANIALSKRRAASVMGRLIADYGVDPAQLRAEGMGFLAPRASNLTEAGRKQNRRVEAILTSME